MVKTSASPQSAAAFDLPQVLKRKKEKADEPVLDGTTKKKQRTRVSYSCGECHRRKQKCDRQIPCSHCLARKVPELCKAYTPGKSEQDLHARISRLEHIIELALPQYAHSNVPNSPYNAHLSDAQYNRSGSVTPDDDASLAEEHDLGSGTFQSGKWYGNSASGSVAPASVLEQLQNVGPSGLSQVLSEQPGLHDVGDKSNEQDKQAPIQSKDYLTLPGVSSILDSFRQGTEPSAADMLQSLVHDCGVSPHKVSELLGELPSKLASDTLIDYYFKSINWTRYPISESDFRASYKVVCMNGPNLNPNVIRFLPLLFVVLAIAVRLAPESIGGNTRTRRISSLRYYWSSRRSLLISAAIQPDSLQMILTRLLSARFLTFDRRITECWSQLGAAVRTAQALGLHRDGVAMGMDLAKVEYRRRIWAYLYHADRSYALVLGRPNAIQDEYTSTLPPLNVEDVPGLNTRSYPVAPPLSIPSRMTFVILRHGLATIIGRMVHHFQKVRHTNHQYADVLALDDELQRFIDTLPRHFAFNPDKSLDAIQDYIPVHRFLLTTEILFVRISLHRPYLLRRLDSDRYIRSRRSCFQSALMDFEVRQAFRKSVSKPVLESMSNAYRDFQTAMICGIYLVLEPKGADAERMHVILDSFLKDHEDMNELDETTRRELKIIELLKSKASLAQDSHVTKNAHSRNGSAGDHSLDAQANLLLNLQQSRPTSAVPQAINRVPEGVASNGSPTVPNNFKPQSPTFQRVDGQIRGSPVISSPGAEEESSAAQNLLDHWCNTVTTVPTTDTYITDGGAILPSQWGAFAGMPMTADGMTWQGANTNFMPGADGLSLNGTEGSDWNLWETLVNHLRPQDSTTI